MFAGYLYKKDRSGYGLVDPNEIILGSTLTLGEPIEIYDSKWHKGKVAFSVSKGGYYFSNSFGEDTILYTGSAPTH